MRKISMALFFACLAAAVFFSKTGTASATELKVMVTEVGPEIGISWGSDGFVLNNENPAELLAIGGWRAGVFKSIDSGLTWSKADSELTDSQGVYALTFNFCVHPQKPATVLAATVIGGLFRSADFGDSWSSIGSLPNPYLADCAFDPISPDVIYALNLEVWESGPGPLFKSVDGGANFLEVGNGLPDFTDARSIAVAPPNPNLVYVSDIGTFQGVYKSEDGGLNFSRLASGPSQPFALIAHPSDPAVLYALAESGSSGLFRSSDAGATFIELTTGLPTGAPTAFSLALDPHDPSIIYAGFTDGLFTSTDDGATFSDFGKLDPKQLGWFGVLGLSLDPDDPKRLYVNTSKGNFRSVNGGKHFMAINRGWRASQINHLSFDSHANPRLHLAVYNTVGLLRTSNGGKKYQTLGENLPNVQATSVAVGPDDDNFLVVATLGGIFRSTDGGKSWSAANIDTGQTVFGQRVGSRVVIDPQNSDNVYAVTADAPFPGFYRSTDGGQSFVQSNAGLIETELTTLALHPQETNLLYVGGLGNAGIFKSVDAGLSFFPTGQSDGNIADIVLDPGNPDLAYIGLGSGPDRVRRSQDGGAAFTTVDEGLLEGPVKALAIAPGNSSRLFVWLGGSGVFMSDDGADSWISLDPGGETIRRSAIGKTMAVDPKNPNVVYAGSGSLLKIEIQP